MSTATLTPEAQTPPSHYGDIWVLRPLPEVAYAIYFGHQQGVVHRVTCGQRWGYPSAPLTAATVAEIFSDQHGATYPAVLAFCGTCIVKRGTRRVR